MMTREEHLQEALISWVLAGGSCFGLVEQLQGFVDGLMDIDAMGDGGNRQARLHNFKASLDHAAFMAGKVDRAGLPEFPPHMKPVGDRFPLAPPAYVPMAEPSPIKVLIDLSGGVVNGARASHPVSVMVWNRDEVREGMVPTTLRGLRPQPIQVLSEDEPVFPETQQLGSMTLYLMRVGGRIRFDRAGKPIYCTIPDKELGA